MKWSAEQPLSPLKSLAAITLCSQLGSSACLPLYNSICHPEQQFLCISAHFWLNLLSPFLAKPVIGQGATKLPKVYGEQVMGNWVIMAPADKRQPLLWYLGWICSSQPGELQGNILFHYIMQYERDNYSAGENRQERPKSLNLRPLLLSIKQKVNARICSIFQFQL